jgi:hypothetical protein
MQSLADLSGDHFFDYMSLRWQSFLCDVNLRTQGNMAQTENGFFRAEKEIRPIVPVNELKGNIEATVSTPTMEGHGIDTLFDGDLSTYFAQDMDMPPEQGPSFIQLRMKTTVRANTLTLGLYNPELYPEDVVIFIKGENEQEFKEVTYTRAVSRRYLAYYFDVSEVRELRVLSKHLHGQNRLVIGELAFGMSDWNHPADPDFGSYLSDVFEMSAPEFGLRLEAAGADTRDIVAIFRHGRDARSLTQNPWELDFIQPLSVNTRPVEDRFYQFKVLAKGSALKSGWKNLEVTGGISLTERTGVGR